MGVARRTARRTARRHAAYYYRKQASEDAMANDGETTEAGGVGDADDDESRMLRPARRVAHRTARRTARRHAAYYYRKLTGEDAMANDGETTEAGGVGGADNDESRMLRPARRVARRTARRTARHTARRHAAYYYRKLTGEDTMANDDG